MNTAAAPATNIAGSDRFKQRFLYRLIFVSLGGMVLDGYILGIIGPVTTPMEHDLHINSLWEGLIAAASLFGILIGSPIGGWAADKFGRKPLFLIDISVFVVSSALQFVAHDAVSMLLVRLLMGVAIGCEYSVGWPIMSEFSPTRLRGRLLGALTVFWYVGFMIGYTVGFVLGEYTGLDWRVILGTSTIIAAVILVARIGLPESPRWLWNEGRQNEARAVVAKYMEADTLDDLVHEEPRKGSFRMLFGPSVWRATLFCSGFWFCAVSPYFAIATFAGTVLDKYGLGSGLAGGVGLSAVSTAGVVATVLFLDKAGRRVFTVPPMWLCTVVLGIIGFWVGAPPLMVLALFLIFSFFNAMANTLTSVYPGEVFPTEIRGIGTGFAAAVSRLGAGAGTFLLPVAIDNLGTGPSMLIAAVVSLLGALLSQWLAPETRGRSLSEAAATFSH